MKVPSKNNTKNISIVHYLRFHNADVSDGTHNYDYNPCYSFVAGDGNCASGITAVSDFSGPMINL